MELVLVVAFLIGLALLAPRFGQDSRTGLRSDEERLSTHGFAWGSHADRPAAAPCRAARPMRLAPPSRLPRWAWQRH
jgi:hypothetical protein